MDNPSANPEPDSAADLAAEDASYYRQILREMTEIAAELARMVLQAAKDAPVLAGGTPAAQASLAVDRLARIIRRNGALVRKLAEPLPQRAPARPTPDRVAARRQIIRAVEDRINEAYTDPEAEGLRAELQDRLDTPDLDDDITTRPVAEIIAEICHDLGLHAAQEAHRWKRRLPEDLAALRALAGRPPRPPPPASWTPPPGWGGQTPPPSHAPPGPRCQA